MFFGLDKAAMTALVIPDIVFSKDFTPKQEVAGMLTYFTVHLLSMVIKLCLFEKDKCI